MSFEVRIATSEDLEDIVDIFLECWQQSYRDLLPEDVRLKMTKESARELWRPSLSSRLDKKTLLIISEKFVVGVARFGSDIQIPERGHLFSLYIHPKYAGKGFGKALLVEVLEVLASEGFTEISLWVFKENQSAQRLYRKCGFLPTGLERTDERWKIPEIEMLKNGTNLQN